VIRALLTRILLFCARRRRALFAGSFQMHWLQRNTQLLHLESPLKRLLPSGGLAGAKYMKNSRDFSLFEPSLQARVRVDVFCADALSPLALSGVRGGVAGSFSVCDVMWHGLDLQHEEITCLLFLLRAGGRALYPKQAVRGTLVCKKVTVKKRKFFARASTLPHAFLSHLSLGNSQEIQPKTHLNTSPYKR